MKYLLGTFIILALPCLIATGETNEHRYEAGGSVYVCQSPGAKRFHCARSCRGLNNCKHTITQVSQAKAEGIGLTPCKMCY